MYKGSDTALNDNGKQEYLKLCIGYRLLSLLCCTAAYLVWLPKRPYEWHTGAAVSVGMAVACLVGTFLYRKTFFEEENRIWLFITLILELGTYGVFICLSGGLSSPYLWYFAGCLFLMAATGRYSPLLALSVVWCLWCTIIGGQLLNPEPGFGRSDGNTVIGILIVVGGFRTIMQYINRLEKRRLESEQLNEQLVKEKEATEQALRQITDLYDIINLFTVASQKQGMDEMARLLVHTIAPSGCLILKYHPAEHRNIDMVSSCGLEEETVCEITREIKEQLMGTGDEAEKRFTVKERRFVARNIGKGIFLPGILVTACEGEEAGEDETTIPFFLNLIEMMFRDRDMHKNLEDGLIREEQQRIANEIHDTVIQKLFGISCSLKVLEHEAGRMEKDIVKERIQNIEQSVRLTMQELREAIYGIRFEGSSGDSFEDKLRLYLQEAGQLSLVPVTLETGGDFSLLSAGEKTVVYRIVCEAVNNAVRHGKASSIGVKTEVGDNGTTILIKDNGRGFQPEEYTHMGNGIKNMYHMVSLMKGTCSVRSAPGKGTAIDAFLPR